MMNKSKLYRISGLVVAFVTFLGLTVAVYVNNQKTIVAETLGVAMSGKPLAAYEDVYPVLVDKENHLYLDKDKFVEAIRMLRKTPSEQAIADLIYLGQQNNIVGSLTSAEKEEYQALAGKLSHRDLEDIVASRDALFRTYKAFVNGVGETFAGSGIEIVLHDTRNPIKSIIAVQNPISGRRIGDPNTNFGLQLIKDYSAVNLRGASYISYPLTLKDGRAVKSTTIPIFDDHYGLVGFICLNFDISKLKAGDKVASEAFVQTMIKTEPQAKIEELIDNAKAMATTSQEQPK